MNVMRKVWAELVDAWRWYGALPHGRRGKPLIGPGPGCSNPACGVPSGHPGPCPPPNWPERLTLDELYEPKRFTLDELRRDDFRRSEPNLEVPELDFYEADLAAGHWPPWAEMWPGGPVVRLDDEDA